MQGLGNARAGVGRGLGLGLLAGQRGDAAAVVDNGLHYRFLTTGKLQRWPLRRAEGAADYEIPVSMVCNHLETRICFAIRGHGIACLPDFTISQQLARGELVTVLDDHLDHGGCLYLLWPSGRQMSPKLRVFIDFMEQRLFAHLPPTARMPPQEPSTPMDRQTPPMNSAALIPRMDRQRAS